MFTASNDKGMNTVRFALFTCVTAASAFFAAQLIMNYLDGREPASQRAATLTASPSKALTPTKPVSVAKTAPHGPASIAKSKDGHYWAEASVNGTRVRFLVDTGATAVALSPTDARRLGYDPTALPYGHRVMTASGEARAARITLDYVSVSGAKISDVEAYVIENGLDTSLLGMTYLGRLASFEASPSSLILRP